MTTSLELELMANLKLTNADKEKMPAYARRWIDIGVSTDPIGHRQAEKAVQRLYESFSLVAPPIRWYESPRELAEEMERLGIWQRPMQRSLGLESKYLNIISDEIGYELWTNIGAPIAHELLDLILTPIYRNLVYPLRIPFHGGWMLRIIESGPTGLANETQIGIMSYLHDVVGACPESSKEVRLLRLKEVIGWHYLDEDHALLSERPTKLERDNDGRLHCEDGPAVAYPDGFSMWSWHGVTVPQAVIESPKALDVKQALDEMNVEVRRVMLTRIGAERLSNELTVVELDQDLDGRGMPRRLFSLAELDDRRFVGYRCPSTGREYPAQPVPPEVYTCAEAVAWRFGALDVDRSGELSKQFDYQPIIEG